MSARILSAVEQKLLLDFLGALREEKIPYVLLRNYEGFPAEIGNDLDVFIPRHEVRRVDAIFRKLLAAAGGEVLVVMKRDYFLDLRFVVGGGGLADAIHLDLFHGSFTWHSLPYLSEEKLLAEARDFRGHPIPRPAHEAFNLLYASVLYGGFFKDRYQPRLAELLADPAERAAFDACVRDAFGPTGKAPFDFTSPEHPSKGLVRGWAKKLRRAFKWRSIAAAPLATPWRLARHWCSEFSGFLRPRGMHLAVLGPDGAGKTTALEGISARVGTVFSLTWQHHWRPSVLPEFGVLLRRRENDGKPVTHPHAKPPHPAPIALFRLAYYWLDYWLGWPLRIWKPKAQVHLVLFDRYAVDMALDPRRYRFALPRWLLRFVARLTPWPDFTFVLVADGELLARRKGEVQGELANQMAAAYRDYAKHGGRRVIPLDATLAPDKISDEVERVIVSHLRAHERYSTS